jgi:hypothetical protein
MRTMAFRVIGIWLAIGLACVWATYLGFYSVRAAVMPHDARANLYLAPIPHLADAPKRR